MKYYEYRNPSGGSYEDSGGVLKYNNDFSMESVKRFYVIEHPDINI